MRPSGDTAAKPFDKLLPQRLPLAPPMVWFQIKCSATPAAVNREPSSENASLAAWKPPR